MLTDVQELAAVAREELTIKLARCSKGRWLAGAQYTQNGRGRPDLSLVTIDERDIASAPPLVDRWVRAFIWVPHEPCLSMQTADWRTALTAEGPTPPSWTVLQHGDALAC